MNSMTRNGDIFLHSTAQIYGDVRLKPGVSVWCNAVIRAETQHVAIGKNTNIQDFVMIHIGFNHPTVIGENCSIAHRVTLHGCTIGNDILIGIGSVIMDGCHIGSNSIVAGGSFLKEHTIVPENSVVMGTPARVVRSFDNSEENRRNALFYRCNAEAYHYGNHRLWSNPQFKETPQRTASTDLWFKTL